MKKSIFYFVLGLFALSTIAFMKKEEAATNEFNESFSKTLLHAKQYTLKVAEAMPADNYKYRPTDSVRTFGEQMTHIGMSTSMILHKFIKGEEMKMDMEANQKLEKSIGASKEQTIKLLNNAFDDAIKSVKDMDGKGLNNTFVFPFSPDKPELTNEQGFLFLRDHITHHRGQAIIYLRMRGIKPPPYSGF